MHASIPLQAAEMKWVFISGGYPHIREEYAYILGVQAPDFKSGLSRFAALGVEVINTFAGQAKDEGVWGICGGPDNYQRIESTWMNNHTWHEGMPEVQPRPFGLVILHMDDGRVFWCDQDQDKYGEE